MLWLKQINDEDEKMMMMMMKIYVTQSCGLRPSVLGQDRSETPKIGLGLDLADLISYCHGYRHNDLEGHSNFSSVSLFCAWNITTVAINSGVHLLKS